MIFKKEKFQNIIDRFLFKDEKKALGLFRNIISYYKKIKEQPQFMYGPTTSFSVGRKIAQDDQNSLLFKNFPLYFFNDFNKKSQADTIKTSFPYFIDKRYKILKYKNIIINFSFSDVVLLSKKSKENQYKMVFDNKNKIMLPIVKNEGCSDKIMVEDLTEINEGFQRMYDFYTLTGYDTASYLLSTKEVSQDEYSNMIKRLISEDKENKDFIVLLFLSIDIELKKIMLPMLIDYKIIIKESDILDFYKNIEINFLSNTNKEKNSHVNIEKVKKSKKYIINILRDKEKYPFFQQYFFYQELHNELSKNQAVVKKRMKV